MYIEKKKLETKTINMIKEQYFIDNGWELEYCDEDLNKDGIWTTEKYYALHIADGFGFITSYEKDGLFTVDFFDSNPAITFDDIEQLDAIIKIAIDGLDLKQILNKEPQHNHSSDGEENNDGSNNHKFI